MKVIAIDGPAGSGKSTVAKQVAVELGFLYIDTGAMYRALTLKAMNNKLDFNDEEALVALSRDTDIELKQSEGSLVVYLDKVDVTDKIRTMEVTGNVKLVAPIKDVRETMVRMQRKLGSRSTGAVLEGRDIGTVVFPEAKYKFYLDASFDTRVKRRFDEFREKGISISREEVQDDVRSRDDSDMTRSIGPLKKSEDAIVIETTDMIVQEVVDRILDEVRA
ncbi:MAG: (d)CMP kinase [Candidatus Omnitrophota bacterium]